MPILDMENLSFQNIYRPVPLIWIEPPAYSSLLCCFISMTESISVVKQLTISSSQQNSYPGQYLFKTMEICPVISAVGHDPSDVLLTFVHTSLQSKQKVFIELLSFSNIYESANYLYRVMPEHITKLSRHWNLNSNHQQLFVAILHCHYVQFILFYMCSFCNSFTEAFLHCLLEKLFDLSSGIQMRTACAAYLGSFLCHSHSVHHTTKNHC